MIVQKKVSVGGNWAKLGVDFDEGDVITLVSEGDMVPGEFGERLVFKVSTKNGGRNLSLNQTSINHLHDGLGNDTAKWKGQNVKVWVVDQNVSGKIRAVVYLTPTEWKKVRVNGELKFVPEAVAPSANNVDAVNAELAGEDMPF